MIMIIWIINHFLYWNPIEGIQNFRKNSRDLIILDLKMPKMDGMTLYRKIKEIDDTVIVCLYVNILDNAS